nr:TetR/AcrR family transcriptional regulator [Rhodococcus sp. (in: high G+C Gram-positive bacteria)]
MPTSTPPTKQGPRERLLKAAALFYTEGIRAVGINRVLDAAQTPIMSLYRQFGSKDGLVEAFLVDKDARVRALFEREVNKIADTGRDKALAVFDVLALVIAEDDFRGCTFVNVAVEMADASHPFVDIARAHKSHARELFASYLREAGIVDAEPLAAQMLLLMDGVFVAAQMQAPYDATAQARRAATVLIDDALRQQKT